MLDTCMAFYIIFLAVLSLLEPVLSAAAALALYADSDSVISKVASSPISLFYCSQCIASFMWLSSRLILPIILCSCCVAWAEVRSTW